MALAMATSVPTAAPMSTIISSIASSRLQQAGPSNLCFRCDGLSSNNIHSLKGFNQKVSIRKNLDSAFGFRRAKRVSLGVCSAALKKLDEVEAVVLTSGAEVGKEIPSAAGVYAIFDKEGKLQYVGISRRLNASVQTHLQDLPDLCGSVKVAAMDAPDKAALTEAWREWIQGYVEATGDSPPGNVSGVTTWTTRKSRPAKPELRLTPGPNKELNIPLTELIDKVVKEIPVVAFIKGTRTAPQCGFSHRVLTILNQNGADYEVVNVLDDHYNPGLREAIKEYSNWPTIPQLYVNGELVGGADIVNELAESGEIKNVLKK
ncbi:unnamed protein product [Calypogeia fissa]